MRLRIIFYANKDLVLPLHYNHMIQKNIYDLLDFDYSSFLHDKGFEYDNRRFKLFTFSKLVVENKDIKKDKIIIKKGQVNLTIATIDERFIFSIIRGLLKRKKFVFHEGELNVEEVYARKDTKFNKLVALTISPVVVKKYSVDKMDDFYKIHDEIFIEKIKENLLKKYFAYYNRKYDNELSIEILDKNRTKKVVDFYKKFPIEGYLAGFVLKGEKDILDIAYSCGIGNKNSQGFGCIEKIDEINKFDNYIKVL